MDIDESIEEHKDDRNKDSDPGQSETDCYNFIRLGKTEGGFGDKGMLLESDDEEPIFSVRKIGEEIEIREECDGYFFKRLIKKEAVKLFKEFIRWIEI